MRNMKRFIKPVHAHCDAPCGHYETDTLKNSAVTCRKLTEKIIALGAAERTPANLSQFVRMVKTKDEHAQICKTQVYILWSDYFKPVHYQRYPELMQQLHRLAQTCSQVRQTTEMAAVEALLEQVGALDKLFQATQAA